MEDLDTLSAEASTVVLSLPDGAASTAVAERLGGAVTHVVDTSTIGVEAAQRVDDLLADAGIAYVDAPVSGGVAGARARTLTVMVAGAPAAVEAVEPVLAGLSDRRFVVGDRPGLGQALKLANNFLSATALAATSEALAFGTAVGLDPTTMLEVLNVSSGQSAASRDKFVDHVLPERYASGFANTLMAKDVGLYLEAARAAATPTALGTLTDEVWRRFAEVEPDADFTRIYPYTRDG